MKAQVRNWWDLFEPGHEGKRGGAGKKGQGAFIRYEGFAEHRDFLFTLDSTSSPGNRVIAFYSKQWMSTSRYTYHGIWTSEILARRTKNKELWGYSSVEGRYEPFPVPYNQVFILDTVTLGIYFSQTESEN